SRPPTWRRLCSATGARRLRSATVSSSSASAWRYKGTAGPQAGCARRPRERPIGRGRRSSAWAVRGSPAKPAGSGEGTAHPAGRVGRAGPLLGGLGELVGAARRRAGLWLRQRRHTARALSLLDPGDRGEAWIAARAVTRAAAALAVTGGIAWSLCAAAMVGGA